MTTTEVRELSLHQTLIGQACVMSPPPPPAAKGSGQPSQAKWVEGAKG